MKYEAQFASGLLFFFFKTTVHGYSFMLFFFCLTCDLLRVHIAPSIKKKLFVTCNRRMCHI
jgi:hypothetical protein